MISRERVGFCILLGLSIVLLIVQMRGMFTTPVYDSYLWWGDESWLMFEFREQMHSGVFRHPFALGSTLAHGSGFLFSNMWITAVLYGGSAALIHDSNIVAIGRIETSVLSVGLLCLLYASLRRLDITRAQSLLGVLFLQTSLSFFFTSHSARYDIVSALTILSVFFWILRAARRVLTLRTTIAAGVLTSLSLLVSIHVLLLVAAPIGLFVVYHSQGKRPSLLLAYAASVMLAGLTLYGSYLIIYSGGQTIHSSFALNLREVPVFRLFSRSVQFANLAQKSAMLWRFAPMVLIAFLLSIGLLITRFRKRIEQRWIVWTIIAALVSWTLLESSAPSSYVIYVLPLMILMILHSLDIASVKLDPIVCVAIGVVLTVFASIQVIKAESIGGRISEGNRIAVRAALDSISHDSTTVKSAVLAFSPAVTWVSMDTSASLVTTQFIEYGLDTTSAAAICQHYHVRYLLAYSSMLKSDYMREVTPLRALAESHGLLVYETAGVLTDIARDYSQLDTLQNDTLKLYKLHD